MSIVETPGSAAVPPVRLGARLLASPRFVIAATVLMAIVLMAILAPLIAPNDPNAISLTKRLVPPVWEARGSWDHPLGTDAIGRDYLSRLIWGARASLVIGVSAVTVAAIIGCTLGILGGFFGGRIDMLVTYIVTCRLAMPGALVVLTLVSLIGPSIPTLILVIGLLFWPSFAIVSRTATMDVMRMEFVTAAVASGATRLRIVVSEVLPNIANPILVIATLELAYIIIAESSLSFLGLGVQAPTPAWGLMIAEGKRAMFTNPTLVTLPGIALMVLVLSINTIGDALRDATDPTRQDR
jgi:peptide/nickel transport system permease protein